LVTLALRNTNVNDKFSYKVNYSMGSKLQHHERLNKKFKLYNYIQQHSNANINSRKV